MMIKASSVDWEDLSDDEEEGVEVFESHIIMSVGFLGEAIYKGETFQGYLWVDGKSLTPCCKAQGVI